MLINKVIIIILLFTTTKILGSTKLFVVYWSVWFGLRNKTWYLKSSWIIHIEQWDLKFLSLDWESKRGVEKNQNSRGI